MVSVIFVALVLACGAALTRAVRLPLNVAPLSGLALLAVVTTWTVALRAPVLLSTGLIAAIAIVGIASLMAPARAAVKNHQLPLVVLAISAAVPGLVLGIAFAGIEAPVSTHD